MSRPRDCRCSCCRWKGCQGLQCRRACCCWVCILLQRVETILISYSNSELCNECFYCRRGQLLLCEKFEAHGVTMGESWVTSFFGMLELTQYRWWFRGILCLPSWKGLQDPQPLRCWRYTSRASLLRCSRSWEDCTKTWLIRSHVRCWTNWIGIGTNVETKWRLPRCPSCSRRS